MENKDVKGMSSLEREAADRMRATNLKLIPPLTEMPPTQQPPPQVNVAPQQVNIAAPSSAPPSNTSSTLISNLEQDGRVKMEPKVHAPPAKNPQGGNSIKRS